MSEEKISPIKVYGLLPGKNCGECGVPTCMAFSLKLIEASAEADLCPYIDEDSKKSLQKLILPPVKKVAFGKKRIVYIGGEKSLHRHIQRFYNPTAVGIELEVNASYNALLKKVKKIDKFKICITGEELGIDFIYLSCHGSSDNALKILEYLKRNIDIPLMLSCTSNSLNALISVVHDNKPVLCGADKENIDKFINVSKEFDCPITVRSKSLGELEKLSEKAFSAGCEVVLNPVPNRDFNALLSMTIQIRLAAIEHDVTGFKHPILTLPYIYSESRGLDEPPWKESLAASACILRYSDAIVLRSTDFNTLTPVYTLRQGYFSNPREPATVKPGLYTIGKTKPDSNVILTTNYALTYYLVYGDLQTANLNIYLLVVDSQGMSVDNALAGRLVDGSAVAKLIKETNIEKKISSKKLIIPRGFSKLKGDIEEAAGWEVLVGPADSAELSAYLSKLSSKP